MSGLPRLLRRAPDTLLVRATVYASLDPRHADRLLFAGAAAIAVHTAVILGVGFEFEPPQDRELDSINVTLVVEPTEAKPESAYEIADANQRGGAEQAINRAESNPLSATVAAPEAEMAQAPAPLPAPVAAVADAGSKQATADAPSSEATPTRVTPAPEATAQRTPVLRQAPTPKPAPAQSGNSDAEADARAPVVEHDEPLPRLNAATLLAQAREVASLSARVGKRASASARGAREATVTANTREHRLAAYMDSWREKIERIGNLNYPERARRAGLTGTLLLDVAIDSSGKVAELRLLRSSGHTELDRAAQRIVKLAAPFAKFPRDIAKDFDIIHIQRTWRFSVVGLKAG